MQVNATPSNALSQVASAASRANNTSDFQAALDAAQQTLAATGGSVSEVAAPRKTAGEELAEYQSKSLAERIRDAILKEMGVTEEDLDAMPPEQRAAVEDEIAERIEARLLAEDGSAQNSVNPGASLLSLLKQQQAAVEQLSSSSARSFFEQQAV